MRVLHITSGGVHGYAYIGAINALIKQHALEDLEVLVGVSAGALVGYLYCLGLDIDEMREAFSNFEWDTPRYADFLLGKGLYSMDNLHRKLEEITMVHLRMKNPTFLQLRSLCQYTLDVFAYDMDSNQSRSWSADTDPSQEIIPVLLASCAIPLLCPPQIIDRKSYIDGGVSLHSSYEKYSAEESLVLRIKSNTKHEADVVASALYLIDVLIEQQRQLCDKHYLHPKIDIHCPALSLFSTPTIETQDTLIRLGYRYVGKNFVHRNP